MAGTASLLPAAGARLRQTLVLAIGLAAGAALGAPPRFEDTMAQRVLACTGCHGPQGRAAPDGYYPRIAGKPPGYLYNQLLNFRDLRRRYALMNDLLLPLSDGYLREIAEHFAGLDVAYPAPQPPREDAQTIERGHLIVTQGDPSRRLPACVQCHGAALMGVTPAIPGLLGLPRDYLNAQLGAFRNGSRHAQEPDCMAEVAKALTPEEIGAVSAWLAAQPAQGKPAENLPGPLPLSCGGVDKPAPTATKP